ncbi:hypothetical protein PQ689_09940 [Thermoanaerobacterium thermosaccharolyticum]|uniref:hypothetical protein n=1 Tax=Thermoanaerobacterium thermosaccharolyticum TaxID=1517 RepID=UPI003DA8A10D
MKHGIFPFIVLDPRAAKEGFGIPGINDDGIPTGPKNPELPMKYDGSCKGKNRSFRNKFICPKTKKLSRGKYICSCEDPVPHQVAKE